MRAPLGRGVRHVGAVVRRMPLVRLFGVAVAVVVRCMGVGTCAGVGAVPSTAMCGREISARSFSATWRSCRVTSC
jgi:hypothetical protein